MIIRLFFIFLSFLYINTYLSAEIVVGVYSDKPLIFKNKQNIADGFWIDLLKYIAKKNNLKIKYYYGEWDEIYSLLQKGKIDILPDIAITKERKKIFDFNKINVLTCWGEIVVKDTSNINTIFDLKDKKIACIPNDIHCIEFKKLMKKFNIPFKFVPVKKYIDTFKLISEGRVDAGAINNIFYLNNSKKFSIKETSIVYNPIDLRFASPKGDPKKILPIIDKELLKLKKDKNSFYYFILNKWIKKETIPFVLNRKVVIISFLIIIFLIIVVITMNWLIKKKTNELKEANITLNTLFNGISDAIFLHDIEGNIIDVNESMAKMYKISKKDALKMTIFDFTENKLDFPVAKKYWQKVIQGKFVPPFEWIAKRPLTGETFYVEVSLRKIKIKGKDLILASVRDITDRKEKENEILLEREKFKTYFELSPVMILQLNTKGEVVLINKKGCDILECEKHEIIGKNWFENFLPDNIKDKVYDVFKKILNGEISKVGYFENEIKTKSGKIKLIAWHNSYLKNKNGEIEAILSVGEDITAKKLTEKELIKIKKLESIAFLAGGIAHDFNNYLTGILGNITLLHYFLEKNEKEKLSRALEKIEKICENAKHLTYQLLTFAKGGEPVLTATSIKEVIEETCNFILSGSNIKANIYFEDGLKNSLIDKNQISQVIQNILLNAKEVLKEGGQIDIVCKNKKLEEDLVNLKKGDYIQIEIKDSGPGIPEDIIDKIFDPFFSTKEKGSGLGLAICHSIVTKHNGYIFVDSKIGKGTKFTILLPATNEKISQEKNNKESENFGNIKKLNVLVIDDEPYIREMFSEILSLFNHNVFLAENSTKAFEIINNHKIDVAFIDLTIPGDIGGLKIFQKIKEFNPEIKAIVMSGYSTDPVIKNYKKYGFLNYLKKPFKLQQVKNILENI